LRLAIDPIFGEEAQALIAKSISLRRSSSYAPATS
jgi:hypothetical protein